ncbi:MAG: hypothetical protein ABFS35_14985 [Bacteroidota bacterium]
MFDFFIEIMNDGNSNFPDKKLFASNELCEQTNCNQKKIDGKNIKVIALSKDKQFRSIHESGEFIVLIYGYSFTRLDSEQKTKKRLFADDILEIYKTKGKNITSLIKGSYTILIYNKNENSIEVFTDELNLRNVYYSKIEDKFILSSSLSAFINYSKEDFGSVNLKSVVEYALFDFDLANETFVENVRSIPSASYLHYVGNSLIIKQYWDIFSEFENAKPVLNEKDSYNQIESLLKQNLSLYLTQPEKTAFALTGGYDSRTNLALLNGKYDNGYYYSYGVDGSYDIKFAKVVADKLKLNFNAFILDRSFADDFDKNAEIAINMGDGIAEMNRANYVHVFKKITEDFDYILTGLFGSELIKRPTSLGGYIDENVQSLLLSDNIKKTYEDIIKLAKSTAFINPEVIDEYKDEIFDNLVKNQHINNEYSGAKKFFFFITGKGIRRYFMKEIKVERGYVENLHPYLDIEFIELLLKTPFPWLYNWETKKSLLENLKIHKFYAKLINDNNRKLSDIPTTHAYKPKFLLKKIYLPLLILQYVYYRRKIKKTGIFRNEKLIWDFYSQRKNSLKEFEQVFVNENIENDYLKHLKEFSKLVSLQVWLKSNKLTIS